MDYDLSAFFNELTKLAVKTTTLQDVVQNYAKDATQQQRTNLHKFGVRSMAKTITNGTAGDKAIKTLRRRSLGQMALRLAGMGGTKTAAIGDIGSQSARSKLNKPPGLLRQTMASFASAPTQHMPAAKLPVSKRPVPGSGSVAPGHLPAASKTLTSLAQRVRAQ